MPTIEGPIGIRLDRMWSRHSARSVRIVSCRRYLVKAMRRKGIPITWGSGIVGVHTGTILIAKVSERDGKPATHCIGHGLRMARQFSGS